MAFTEKQIDVICQHTRESKIIPLRIRLQDEDGEFHTYNIKEYKDTSPTNCYTLSNGMMVSRGTWSFDAKIAVFGNLKNIRLFYHLADNKWTIIK